MILYGFSDIACAHLLGWIDWGPICEYLMAWLNFRELKNAAIPRFLKIFFDCLAWLRPSANITPSSLHKLTFGHFNLTMYCGVRFNTAWKHQTLRKGFKTTFQRKGPFCPAPAFGLRVKLLFKILKKTLSSWKIWLLP